MQAQNHSPINWNYRGYLAELGQPAIPPEDMMRSELVFVAMTYVSNRFLLAGLASKATRRLHKPNTRIEDTTNEVFQRFSRANPLAAAPNTRDLRLFHYATRSETHPSYEDLEQSVA